MDPAFNEFYQRATSLFVCAKHEHPLALTMASLLLNAPGKQKCVPGVFYWAWPAEVAGAFRLAIRNAIPTAATATTTANTPVACSALTRSPTLPR